jgi:hypothetical protein
MRRSTCKVTAVSRAGFLSALLLLATHHVFAADSSSIELPACAEVVDQGSAEIYRRTKQLFGKPSQGAETVVDLSKSLLTLIDEERNRMYECVDPFRPGGKIDENRLGFGESLGQLNGWYSVLKVGLMIVVEDNALTPKAIEYLSEATKERPPRFVRAPQRRDEGSQGSR